MSTMKAIQVTKPGGVEALQYVDVPIPKPGKGQVLVKNIYSGINFIDTYSTYFIPIEFELLSLRTLQNPREPLCSRTRRLRDY